MCVIIHFAKGEVENLLEMNTLPHVKLNVQIFSICVL